MRLTKRPARPRPTSSPRRFDWFTVAFPWGRRLRPNPGLRPYGALGARRLAGGSAARARPSQCHPGGVSVRPDQIVPRRPVDAPTRDQNEIPGGAVRTPAVNLPQQTFCPGALDGASYLPAGDDPQPGWDSASATGHPNGYQVRGNTARTRGHDGLKLRRSPNPLGAPERLVSLRCRKRLPATVPPFLTHDGILQQSETTRSHQAGSTVCGAADTSTPVRPTAFGGLGDAGGPGPCDLPECSSAPGNRASASSAAC